MYSYKLTVLIVLKSALHLIENIDYLSDGSILPSNKSCNIFKQNPFTFCNELFQVFGSFNIEAKTALGSRIKWMILISESRIHGSKSILWSRIVFITLGLDTIQYLLNNNKKILGQIFRAQWEKSQTYSLLCFPGNIR